MTTYGTPGVPAGGLVSICGRTWNSLCILFTIRSTPPAPILEPCGKKFSSIRTKRISSIALAGVSSEPINLLKLKERNRMPYSRLFPAFGSPARTLKSFLVKLSAVKASTGAAVRSSFHRDNRATRRESQLVRSLKSVPMTIKIALADISEIGWLRGSFRASAILICFICISSFTANAHAVTISKAIPSINSHQPTVALRFCRQKSRISANASFSARFSIQSPQNTRTPPTQAVNAVQNIEAADNEPSDAKIIIYTAIPYAVLFIILVVFAIRFRPGRRPSRR